LKPTPIFAYERSNMSREEVLDLIIVGGGPAGLTAGIYAKRAALKAVLIEKGVPGGQVAITKGVENYPGFIEISGFDLSDKFLQHAKCYGLDIVNKEVIEVRAGGDFHSVSLSNGEVLNAQAIILATGGKARKLNVPGETENFGKGVSYCATCDGFFFRNKIVCVVGGGDTALEDSLYLARITERVYLIHRREDFRASRILQQRVWAETKIETILNTVVTEIKANDRGVRAVALKNTQNGDESELEVEGVFIFAGFSPNSSVLPVGVKTNTAGYVLTDSKCETNILGMFAVGDLRENYANQIVVAAADGCIAALAVARYLEAKKASEKCIVVQPVMTIAS
jgi:thioredoxin reductase (NADPH)